MAGGCSLSEVSEDKSILEVTLVVTSLLDPNKPAFFIASISPMDPRSAVSEVNCVMKLLLALNVWQLCEVAGCVRVRY